MSIGVPGVGSDRDYAATAAEVTLSASTVEQLRENLDAGNMVLDAECLRDLTDAAV